MPLLSVITTVYNCERYIKESIDSVLNQSFKDFEFIILDDGSKDKTTEIIQSYSDSRIRFFRNSDNRGISWRRNEGVALSFGEYIAIHDGDDISYSNRFEEQVKILDENKDIFCVGGWATKIDCDGNKIGEMHYPPQIHSEITKMFLGPTNPMIDPTTMMRKKDFLTLNGYSLDSKVKLVPDFDLWTRAALENKLFYNLLVPVIYYRINPNGQTIQNKMNMIRAHVFVVQKYMANLRKRKEQNGKRNNSEV